MRNSGLTLKLEKCDFAKPQITFLGHVTGSRGYVVDPKKVQCVENMKVPTTKKEVRQLLGFFSYFRTYIKDFTEIAHPITELAKKDVPNQIKWTTDHQQAFDRLKECLCNATKLRVVEYGKPCGILVDTSGVAVGCCLIQWDDRGVEKPIAFVSSKLNPTQMTWLTIEREAYAVIFAFRKYHNSIFPPRLLFSQIIIHCYT